MNDAANHPISSPNGSHNEAVKKLPVMKLLFDLYLEQEDLSAFRGALAERVGREHEWFHNHNNHDAQGPRYHYRYPLIQYKLQQGRPLLVCIGQGVDAARIFFELDDWTIQLRGEPISLKLHELRLKQYPLEAVSLEEGLIYSYRLRYWQALNQENYRKYQEKRGLGEIVAFLEGILTNNLISFAKGVSWNIERHFQVRITEMYPTRFPQFKDIHPLAFNLTFDTNLLLPDSVGIGKAVGLGFGTITRIRDRSRERAGRAENSGQDR